MESKGFLDDIKEVLDEQNWDDDDLSSSRKSNRSAKNATGRRHSPLIKKEKARAEVADGPKEEEDNQ